MTPFYDEIDGIITADNKIDSETMNSLLAARGHLDKMIFERPMLPE